ncbi:HDOD domain-containing protein [Methyloradius palustris]|uniref:HDOD domain-containing protein n=1 Tax=Methyloradius palustris TaxID=2778876 RepID=A0A8D5JV36_9PROT|nr:HDOD domain-containing protein [Methyloradius palustris]BCM23759.1 hypothetical protein ZMTM_00180 [Methyloradius palustris]
MSRYGSIYGLYKRLFNNPKISAVTISLPPPLVEKPEQALHIDTNETAPSADVSSAQYELVDTLFYRWLFPHHLPTLNAKETEILGILDETLHSDQLSSQLVKRMPGLIPQVLQTLKNENFSVTDVAKKLSQDIVLVEAVTRLASAAMKNSREEVKSIEQAVVILGQNGLRQLITSVAFKPIINISDGAFTKTCGPILWKHSEASAAINRKMAIASSTNPLDAFLAGLMQYIGLIVALRIVDQMTNSLDAIGSPEFYDGLIRTSKKLTCKIAKEWQFPETLIQALEDSPVSALGETLRLSDYLSKLLLLSKNKQLQDNETELIEIPEHLIQFC